MSGDCVVIGIGNDHRRDDGVGPAVAAVLAGQDLPGVRVLTCPAEPTAVLDSWEDARVAILVDAAAGIPAGEVRRCSPDDVEAAARVSSHDLGLRQTCELGRALGRAPDVVVLVAVGVADTGHGVGLSGAVAAALPEAVRTVLAIVAEQSEKAAHQQP